MIGYLYILLGQVAHNGEGVFVKHHGAKGGKGGLFFNAIVSFFAMVYFILTDTDGIHIPPLLLAYAAVSCVMYSTGFYTIYVAFNRGSFVLTKALASFSILIPMLFGVVFLGEPAGVLTYVGIGLFVVSIVVMNAGLLKKSDEPRTRFDPIWLISVVLTLLANGAISIISRLQQIHFHNECTKEFLMLSLGGSFLFLLVLSLFKERKEIGTAVKTGVLFGAGAGVCNGISNYLRVLSYLYIPMSIAVPAASAVGLLISLALSVAVYREKPGTRKLIAVLLQILAILSLNL